MKGLSDEEINVLKAEWCYRNFHFFLREFWDVINTEAYSDNWHIKYLCDELQAIGIRVENREENWYDLIINVPPGTSKSTIATIMFPVWIWLRDAKIRTLTASYSGTLAVEHSVKSRDILKSDKFRTLFPELDIRKDFDNKSHYKNRFNGERYATSVRGSVTGMHAHIIIVDDPLNPKEALSDVERENANNFMTATLSTRKVDKKVTPTILIMQRLHENDPTGMLLDQVKEGKLVKHICLPAELSADVQPPELAERYVDGLLDPKRMSKTVLKSLKVAMGSYNYAGQMMQTPAPADGGIYKTDMFLAFDEIPDGLRMIGTDWDLAYTEKTSNSASAYVTAGVYENKMYVLDIGFKWLEFPQLVKWMSSKESPHYIENKASGKSAKQTLINQGINAVEVKVDGGDKVARAMLATPYMESGRVLIHKRVLHKLMYDDQQGLLKFPNNKGDDLADAFAQSINRLLGQHQTFIF